MIFLIIIATRYKGKCTNSKEIMKIFLLLCLAIKMHTKIVWITSSSYKIAINQRQLKVKQKLSINLYKGSKRRRKRV